MAEQMKGISVCGDCAYYSMKKHRCTRGCVDEGSATARFYVDCPFPDVKPIKHGFWNNALDFSNGNEDLECSICGARYNSSGGDSWNYCPNCGAKMTTNIESFLQGDKNG